ncbi:glycoside hydrolase family 3 N-terminal domain-containing protein [Streptomyces sp. NPDC047046]|uniref:beta-xylosidase/alpha-l-arabinosidase n=1 Tax=Streptomyces sp. NPDC047046 TaxID=3155378 RepID=UPI0033E8E3ED
MTREEKTAQLYGLWVGASPEGGEVAPHQHDMQAPPALDDLLPHGLGQLTRPFGTAPVDPGLGALSLLRTQARVIAGNRFGIPALAHEECLAGFAAWRATTFPVPLAWGASFDPELVERVGAAIGDSLRAVGVHQGLAPVLDVVRDLRWGRVEETIGEDPYLVGRVGAAYVRGLESAGIVATLKHFAGYSASRAGRNLAPVSMGPRERADIVLPPFEAALREGGARSVMHAYTDTDGVPSAADRELLTGLLRETWGFEGTVVADYFGVAFLQSLHHVAADRAEAAALALRAGVDVELPTVDAYGAPLLAALDAGLVDEATVDDAVRRVLRQKAELGLLDADFDPVPPSLRGRAELSPEGVRGTVDLDPPEHRELSARLAAESLVLLRNAAPDGSPVLPLAAPRRIAVIGPQAGAPLAGLGCYAFPVHVGGAHPDLAPGIALPTLYEAVAAEFADSDVVAVAGCGIDTGGTEGFAAALDAARGADVVIAALGDRAGLFGRGTSGEGCDAPSLRLPGAQQELLDALLGTGTPVVGVLLAGRPYALGRAVDEAGALVQAFFPGQEGTRAIAALLSGRAAPSGRLPVSVPRTPDGQPGTYLRAPLAGPSDVSALDPSPAYPFGHGLAYTSFAWTDLTPQTPGQVPTDGTVRLALTVTNTGARAGTEVVQVYLHDPVASVVQPEQRLIGALRVPLAPGASARVHVEIPADTASFTGLAGRRVVEPGALEFRLSASSTDHRLRYGVRLTGPVREVGYGREPGARLRVE